MISNKEQIMTLLNELQVGMNVTLLVGYEREMDVYCIDRGFGRKFVVVEHDLLKNESDIWDTKEIDKEIKGLFNFCSYILVLKIRKYHPKQITTLYSIQNSELKRFLKPFQKSIIIRLDTNKEGWFSLENFPPAQLGWYKNCVFDLYEAGEARSLTFNVRPYTTGEKIIIFTNESHNVKITCEWLETNWVFEVKANEIPFIL
ncbi:hypothetical protein [Paenibacillus sp. Leaf72]|uniref:hypothetical protein n=1 Tax=Paenibacillus sp. Leaf72 TaxID=1736234 RepID=UPI00070073EC|nr:hypothetical protein [Paenibacillus sp. Leaf72]KQN96809.1 hypothetical protein ASF12_22310 [Paenibacillus sp. Leaf72]